MRHTVFPFFQKVLRHELIQGSLYVFVGGMISSVLNFLFNIFLTRHITYQDYGTYAAVISLIGLLSIPGQALFPIIIRFATEFFTHQEYGKAKSFYKKSMFSLFCFGLIISCILTLFSPIISNFFQLGSWIFVLITGILVLLGYVSIITNAYLQSLLKFGYVSMLPALGSITKLLFGGLGIIIGFKLWGALGGVFIGAVIPFILGFFEVWKVIKNKKSEKIELDLGKFLSFSISALIAMLAITSFTSSDILLVKHFFSSSNAGLYAGLALVGKIIFYFTAPIITVMFPVLMNKFHKGEKIHNILYISLVLVFLPSLFLSLIYFFFPAFFLNFFLGGKAFLRMTPYVGLYGLYIALFSGCNVLISYFLTLHSLKASYISGTIAAIQIVGILIFHQSFYQVIDISLICISVLFLSLGLLFIRHLQNV